MANADIAFAGIAEAGRLLRSRRVTAVELAELALARIEGLNPALNAYITVTPELAMEAARRADADFVTGVDRGPMQGIPFGIKDLCATKGVRTTAASAVLADWVPDADAAVVERLLAGGGVPTGKLNMQEFAYGVTSSESYFGPVRNPWDPARHPGGSSGGSGAAVAAGLCAMAIGTDTGGSIRIPAAVCGITGLMPSYGVVSRRGVIALAWSLDHIGPMTRSVEDAALALNVIAGYDPGDAGSVLVDGFDAAAELGQPLTGLRIGVVREQFEGSAPGVLRSIEEALATFRSLGCTVEDVVVPGVNEVRWLPILSVEAAAYHAEWLQTKAHLYGEEARTRLQFGFASSGVEYVNAVRLRREFTSGVATLMERYDLLAMPTCPVVTCPIDELSGGGLEYGRLTAPWNHTGQPVLSLPCAPAEEGLPAGISLAARPLEEALLCRAGFAFQQVTDWHKARPPVA